jgi:hypothetical protein
MFHSGPGAVGTGFVLWSSGCVAGVYGQCVQVSHPALLTGNFDPRGLLSNIATAVIGVWLGTALLAGHCLAAGFKACRFVCRCSVLLPQGLSTARLKA